MKPEGDWLVDTEFSIYKALTRAEESKLLWTEQLSLGLLTENSI